MFFSIAHSEKLYQFQQQKAPKKLLEIYTTLTYSLH